MKKIDLSKGSIIKGLLILSLPLILTNLLNLAYTWADMFWIGKLGTSQQSAVGTAGLYYWLSAGVIGLVKIGTEVSIAQNVGDNRPKIVEKYAQTGFKLAIFVAGIFSLSLLLFNEFYIGIFNIQDVQTQIYAQNYLFYLSPGVFASMMTLICFAIFQGSGNTKIVLNYTAIGLIINMILDPLFIFTFNMGVAGAAIATTLSLSLIVILFVVKLYRDSNLFVDFNLFKFDKKYVNQIITISAPNGLQNIFFTMMAMVISLFVVSYGDDAVAAQRIGSQVEGFSWQIGMAITTSIGVFIAQNYGAHNFSRMLEGYRKSLYMMIFYGFIISMMFFMFAESFMMIFSDDPEVILIGSRYLRIIAISQIFMNLEGVAGGFFNGVSKTKIPAFFSIVGNGLRIPLAIWFGAIFGIDGIWIAVSLATILKGLGVFIALEIYLFNIKRKNIKLTRYGVDFYSIDLINMVKVECNANISVELAAFDEHGDCFEITVEDNDSQRIDIIKTYFESVETHLIPLNIK